MKHPVETELLNALELFYYAEQFRDVVFVICFDNKSDFNTLITDLRVLHLSNIKIAIICSDKQLIQNKATECNLRNTLFKNITSSCSSNDILYDNLINAVRDGYIPIVSICDIFNESCKNNKALDANHIQKDLFLGGIHISQLVKAKKLFIVSSLPGLEANGQFLSHILPEETKALLDSGKKVNITQDLLCLIYQEQQRTGLEIVLLPNKRGALYQEIFTHRGKGTLFTSQYPNIIRPAKISDIDDIMMLMRPYVLEEAVLPVAEQELENEINSYYVYTVNNVIVATARLKKYGDSAELGKFCTLPRYQGRGRARELASNLVKIAQDKGFKRVFALSTQPRMWVFFTNLGFEQIDRQELPDEWANNYNFDRPSRAMCLCF